MQVCFIRDGVSLVMPVTPERYQWTSGKRIETININELGDVYRPGGLTRFSGNFDFLLPAQDYPWIEAGAHVDPQYYLDYLTAWATDEKTVRLVITGTEINTLVYIEDVTQLMFCVVTEMPVPSPVSVTRAEESEREPILSAEMMLPSSAFSSSMVTLIS